MVYRPYRIHMFRSHKGLKITNALYGLETIQNTHFSDKRLEITNVICGLEAIQNTHVLFSQQIRDN